MTAPNIATRLSSVVRRVLRNDQAPASAATTKEARAAGAQLQELGIVGIGLHSPDADIEWWEDKLWTEQDPLISELSREWMLHILYTDGEQHLAWHSGKRNYIRRAQIPNRIRSTHNIVQKSVNVRVARLTENKPTVSVQAATGAKDDVERAEYKETLFWGLWDKEAIHKKITSARHWASMCGTGFLKTGFDPDSGCEYPVTLKRPRYEEIQVPVPGPDGQPMPGPDGQPLTQPKRVYAGIEEVYLDANKQPIGPVVALEADPGSDVQRKVRQPIPDNADTYYEGDAFVEERSPFNIRFDRYVDDIDDSWYVQDATVMTGTEILGLYPKSLAQLKDARPASEEDKALQWEGLVDRMTGADLSVRQRPARGSHPADAQLGLLDQEYLVRETWIYPRNPQVRKLWGRKGRLLITVGGKLVRNVELPEWARKHKNFVQLIDIPSKGNHYHKSFLRDVIPLQDDINRMRSMKAERIAILARLILWTQQNHGMSMRALGGMPGVLVTTRTGIPKPEPLQLNTGDDGTSEFLQLSLNAAQDVGNINDASTGKLPSAGTPAKAIYALQYADEKSVAEASSHQDIALARLARSLDAITRVEYKEARKVRIVGEDRSFLVEHEILPEHLDTEVDYFFTPGSMLSRQKEAVKNELITLLREKVIDLATVQRFFPAAVPDAFRRSYNLQQAKARRQIQKIVRGEAPSISPDPFDDPLVQMGEVEEFMLTRKFEILGDRERDAIMQFWQALQVQHAQRQQAALTAQPQPQPGARAKRSGGAAAPRPPQNPALAPAEGARQLEQSATATMEPPEGEPPPQ